VEKHRIKKAFGDAELHAPTLCKSIEKAFGVVVSIIY
jgi:hypothetical protein